MIWQFKNCSPKVSKTKSVLRHKYQIISQLRMQTVNRNNCCVGIYYLLCLVLLV